MNPSSPCLDRRQRPAMPVWSNNWANQAPRAMVRRTHQGSVKQGIVAEKGSKWRPWGGADLSAFGRTGEICWGALRWERNYGLRSQDSPQVPPPARRGARRLADAALTAGRWQRLQLVKAWPGRRRGASFEGAVPTMLVFKRLTALAVTVLA